jgi:hypothetical protein
MNSQFGSPQARLFGNELTLTAMTPAADAAPFQLAPHSGTLIPYSLIIVVSILIFVVVVFFFFFFFFCMCRDVCVAREAAESDDRICPAAANVGCQGFRLRKESGTDYILSFV